MCIRDRCWVCLASLDNLRYALIGRRSVLIEKVVNLLDVLQETDTEDLDGLDLYGSSIERAIATYNECRDEFLKVFEEGDECDKHHTKLEKWTRAQKITRERERERRG